MTRESALHKLEVSALRPRQEQAIDALEAGRDVAVFMPTSFGKSLIFILFALLTEQLVIVIEPHLALEADQLAGLLKKGIPAAFINSLQSRQERKTVLQQLQQGKLLLLYLTPEMLQNKEIRQILSGVKIAGVMVDEAHCIFKQGPGFREAYQRIDKFVRQLSERPVIGAFTATATRATESFICKSLKMDDPLVIRGSVTRDNITLKVIEIGQGLGGIKDADLVELRKREIICKWLKKMPDGRAIIYSNTIERVENLTHYLQKNGFSAGFYHGKCDNKLQRLHDFSEGHVRIMVATNAFGLGVNIPDIRLVIHHSPSIGLDDYVQEAGRAGRDGKKSTALLLWHEYDFTINQRLIRKNEMALTGAERKDRLDSLEALHRYAQNEEECRWRMIREFFGEKRGKRCKKQCDNCK